MTDEQLDAIEARYQLPPHPKCETCGADATWHRDSYRLFGQDRVPEGYWCDAHEPNDTMSLRFKHEPRPGADDINALVADLRALREFARGVAKPHRPTRCDGEGCDARPTLHSATYFGEVNTCEAHQELHRGTPHESYYVHVMRLIGGAP